MKFKNKIKHFESLEDPLDRLDYLYDIVFEAGENRMQVVKMLLIYFLDNDRSISEMNTILTIVDPFRGKNTFINVSYRELDRRLINKLKTK